MRLPVLAVTLLSVTSGVFGSPRWRFDQDRGWVGILSPGVAITNPNQPDRRQFFTSVSSLATDPAPTELATTDALATEPLATDSLSTEPLATSAPPTTSQVLSTPVSTPTPTNAIQTTQSSVPLLFTQSSTTSRPSLTPTATPAVVSDTEVPFFKSKYHQLIIALGSLSVALLLALVGIGIVAFRARADADLLRDRLARAEEEYDLPQRKRHSSHSLGYGRISMSDPDDMKEHRRSVSEGKLGLGSIPRPAPGSKPRAQGPPRRVTFSGTDTTSDSSPLLSSTRDHWDTKPDMKPDMKPDTKPDTRPSMPARKSDDSVRPPVNPTSISPPRPLRQMSGPRPNPAPRRLSLQDPGPVPSQQIRRLPATPNPSSTNSSYSGYYDPYAVQRIP